MELIKEFVKKGYLKSTNIINAFEEIKRKDFVLSEHFNETEEDRPLSIGHGQTISQPLTVAFMLELLSPNKGDKILDIGAGSGWTAALLAHIVGQQGKVFAIERILELKNFGEKNVNKYKFIDSGQVEFILGDGTKGLPNQSPFDRIHVAAAANNIPSNLINQLAINGKMVIPEGVKSQNIVLIEKIGEKKIKKKSFPGFLFVPLIEKNK